MKAKITVFALFFLGLLFMQPSFADPAGEARSLFYEGNSSYKQEKFEAAILSYEKALNLGFESGPLYYNLANAYFKAGFLGKAILNYLKARRLVPEDADLKSNLAYAQSFVKSNASSSAQNIFIRAVFKTANSFSLNKLTIISSSAYFAFAIFIIFAITTKRFRKAFTYISAFLFLLTVFYASLFFAKFHKEFYEKEAVVIARYADCKFEPFISATTFFTLTEGETVEVTNSEKEWVKVKRFDGKRGWVKRSDIEFL